MTTNPASFIVVLYLSNQPQSKQSASILHRHVRANCTRMAIGYRVGLMNDAIHSGGHVVWC